MSGLQNYAVLKMIKIQNIYYMLAYAFRALNESEARRFSFENFEFIDELFTVILAKGIAKQVKRGLGKEYIYHAEDWSLLGDELECLRP